MRQKALLLCGMASPVLFIFMIVLGAELSPSYNHISDTVSELLSPDAPNKLVLVTIHLLSAVLSILFGMGIFQLIRNSETTD